MSADAPEVPTLAEGNGVVVLDTDTPPVIPEAPSTIPEKFKNDDGSLNQQALLKSYSELEKMRGQTPTADTTPTPASAEAPSKGDLKVPDVKQVEKAVGDKLFKEVVEHYQNAGEVSEELYGKLDAQGFSKDFTDFYIGRLEKEASERRESITAEVGGLESYRKIQEWAVDNLSEEQKSAINEAVESKNMTKAQMGVKMLKDLYAAANGSAPNLVAGGAPQGVEGYQSMEETAAAMGDPRWQKDPVYTKNVMDKLAISTY